MQNIKEKNDSQSWAQHASLKELRLAAQLEKDPSRQAVYLSLYNHALQQAQKQIIQRKKFVR
ncbi:hypothetical protein [Levilactobacillus acidifarinae]|nr:hypothetical protein [Levilactobacillus acidifarinae]GEO68232.1 hypothetical protein LAC03_01420 [Levilactobacillus acidifarinae]